MPQAFVTGGTGFLGRHLIEQLLAEGWQVTALYRDAARIPLLTQPGVRWVMGSLADPAALLRVIPEAADAVFHVASNTSHWSLQSAQQTRDNVDGTRHLLHAARWRRARRFVYTSSVAAFGFHAQPITEETPSTALASGINYFRTKRLAELEVLAAVADGLDAVILNPANTLGPHDRHNWSRFLVLAAQNKVQGMPGGAGSFCHAVEVARAHIAAHHAGRTGHHYLLGGADATYVDFIRRIGRVIQQPVRCAQAPAGLLQAVAYPALWSSYLTRREPPLTPEKVTVMAGKLVCRSDKAVRELGYRTIPLDDMLHECYAWMVEAGHLPG